MQSFIAAMIRFRWIVVIATLVITVGLISNLRNLRVIIDPDDTLPQRHPYVMVSNTVEKIFGNKFTVVIGIAPKEGDIYQSAVLEKIKGITEKLSSTQGVVKSNITSLAGRKAKNIVGTEDGMEVTPLMDKVPQTPEQFAKLKAAIHANPAYINAVVSKDEKTAAIYAEFKKDAGGFQGIDDKVSAIVDPFRDDQVEIFVGGAPRFVALIEKYSQRMGFLLPIAILLIGIIHYEAFRTLQGLILPLVTALLAVMWAMGFMGLAGIPLDAFNATTPILILAVAAGHAVQILKRYYEEYHLLRRSTALTPHEANREAVQRSLTKVGPVMIAACTIAALSFASLMTFEILTIRTFGVLTAVGILSALIIEMTFIPALRSLLPPPGEREARREQEKTFWDRIVQSFASWTLGHRRTLFGVSAALVAVMLWGAFQVNSDYTIRRNFSPNLPVRVDDVALNSRLAGTFTLFALIEGNQDDAIKDPRVLKGMDDLQLLLEQQPHVGKTLSIANFIKRINKAMNADNPAFDKIPDTQDLIAQYLFVYSTSGEPGDFDNYVDYGYRNAAIQIIVDNENYPVIRGLQDTIDTFAKEHFPDTVKVSFGGSGTAGIALSEIMVKGKFLNLIQIAGVVFIIASLLFRSLKAGVLILVPLVMTVLVNFGIMGLFGIPLNIATSISSALAVGIGADYAVYFTYRLREQMHRAKTFEEAVRETFSSAGKASLFVATAVAGGYSVLLASYGYNIHIWLGLLVCLAMVVSSISALTLFPALLLTFRSKFVFGGSPLIEGSTAVKTAGAAVLALALLGVVEARAQDPAVTQIMERNFLAAKVSDSVSDATFRLINKDGQERVRETVGYSKLLPNGVDNMRVTRFASPQDIKGTVSLLIEHSEKDDDIWIYLPALKKVRRLVASNKKDSFVGTDFSYGDVIGHKVADWTHKILREEAVDGAACWVIESLPKSPEVQSNSGYSKRVGWIRKDNFTTVKGEGYDESGELFKTFAFSDVHLMDKEKQRYQAMHLEGRNLQTGHRTVIQFKNVKVNQGVSDEFFTTRYMERER